MEKESEDDGPSTAYEKDFWKRWHRAMRDQDYAEIQRMLREETP